MVVQIGHAASCCSLLCHHICGNSFLLHEQQQQQQQRNYHALFKKRKLIKEASLSTIGEAGGMAVVEALGAWKHQIKDLLCTRMARSFGSN
jgi:hypothetical protein